MHISELLEAFTHSSHGASRSSPAASFTAGEAAVKLWAEQRLLTYSCKGALTLAQLLPALKQLCGGRL